MDSLNPDNLINPDNPINPDILNEVLEKILGGAVRGADWRAVTLRGGTVGDVRLVEGAANTAGGGGTQPFKVVCKTQRKWERTGDPDSWRREYDLYASDFESLFTDDFRWPPCYRAAINAAGDVTQIWMEYIDGASGAGLTVGMFERAALEIGRFQGRLYAGRPAVLHSLRNLSKAGDLKEYYIHCRSSRAEYDYIRSAGCEIPAHLCAMLKQVDENADAVWKRIESLPVVLCHRDYWVTNIFFADGKIRLIDWDTAGWGYMGEDIKSLIADEADVSRMVEYYRKCVPAYYRGFSEYANVSRIGDDCVREMILVNLGYRLVSWFMKADTPESRALQIDTLQQIHDMGL